MDDYTGLIHVDSNVIDDRCNNTQSDFINYTNGVMRYSDDAFEVGLVELHIPYTWRNVSEGNYVGVFRKHDLLEGGLIKIDSGFYPSVQSLIDYINKQLLEVYYNNDPGLTDTAFLKVDPTQGKLVENLKAAKNDIDQSQVHLKFTFQLSELLGFEGRVFAAVKSDSLEEAAIDVYNVSHNILHRKPTYWIAKQFSRKYKNPNEASPYGLVIIIFKSTIFRHVARINTALAHPQIYRGIEELFVYCSIVKHHQIGNKHTQVLRVTPVFPERLEDRGQPLVLSYTKPYYYPLFDSSFDKIELQLRDRSGNLIEFESGSTLAILHIRRKNADQLP